MSALDTTRARFKKLSTVCLSFPDTTKEQVHAHITFKVGKRIFAYYLNDHHGDGIVSICCKVLPGDNQRLVAASPRKFYMPAYIGPRGWVALRLDRATVDWNEVTELMHSSYMQTAPKRLTRRMQDE